MKTSPNVYIIESLDPDDEGNGRLEGVFLAHMLRLHLKETKYSYVRTRGEFKEAVKDFKKSGFRYLHVSAHGDKDGIETTNGEEISFGQLGRMLSEIPDNCRLFMSSCKVVHAASAEALVSEGRFRSLLGPRNKIDFHDSAATWAAIYHLAFKAKAESMADTRIATTMKSLADIFSVKFGFYTRSSEGKIENLLRKQSD